LNVQKNKNWA